MTGLGSEHAARFSRPDKMQRKSGALFKALLLSEWRSVLCHHPACRWVCLATLNPSTAGRIASFSLRWKIGTAGIKNWPGGPRHKQHLIVLKPLQGSVY